MGNVKLKKKKRIETNDSFFFVNADGGKVRKPIVIVENKKLVFLNRWMLQQKFNSPSFMTENLWCNLRR